MAALQDSITTGRKSSISTSEVRLITDSGLRANEGVLIYANTTNSGVVYIGRSGLTADSSDSTDGFPLNPGSSILIKTRIPSNIYLLGSSPGQKVWFIVL